MHNELCPMAELAEDCHYIKETGHHLREHGCAYCQRECECDLIERVLNKAVDRIIELPYWVEPSIADDERLVTVDSAIDAVLNTSAYQEWRNTLTAETTICGEGAE
jgi:hypothetical protein